MSVATASPSVSLNASSVGGVVGSVGGALAQETVNRLLDFNAKLDIGLLDRVVATMYAGTGEQQKMAQEVLTTLKEHPDAWTKVQKYYSLCGDSPMSKWLALT
jgi:hypothetical protein